MAFKEELYRRVIYVSNDEVTKECYSIFAQTEKKLKEFLNNAIEMSDTEKAKLYADFLMGLNNQTINSILQNAKDIALNLDNIEASEESLANLDEDQIEELSYEDHELIDQEDLSEDEQ